MAPFLIDFRNYFETVLQEKTIDKHYQGILASELHYLQSFPVLANTGIYIYIYDCINKPPVDSSIKEGTR